MEDTEGWASEGRFCERYPMLAWGMVCTLSLSEQNQSASFAKSQPFIMRITRVVEEGVLIGFYIVISRACCSWTACTC